MAMQSEEFDASFTLFLEEERPKRILEIGTSHGGLTLFLRDKLNELNLENSEIISYDVKEISTHENINKLDNVNIIIENIFSNCYTKFKNKDQIENFIKSEGKTVVCCDGGSKKNEINLISPLLKPGDFILAHDYSPSKEYHQKKMRENIWKWCEITDDDIKASDNKLEQVYFDNFIKAAWCCFRKLA